MFACLFFFKRYIYVMKNNKKLIKPILIILVILITLIITSALFLYKNRTPEFEVSTNNRSNDNSSMKTMADVIDANNNRICMLSNDDIIDSSYDYNSYVPTYYKCNAFTSKNDNANTFVTDEARNARVKPDYQSIINDDKQYELLTNLANECHIRTSDDIHDDIIHDNPKCSLGWFKDDNDNKIKLLTINADMKPVITVQNPDLKNDGNDDTYDMIQASTLDFVYDLRDHYFNLNENVRIRDLTSFMKNNHYDVSEAEKRKGLHGTGVYLNEDLNQKCILKHNDYKDFSDYMELDGFIITKSHSGKWITACTAISNDDTVIK